jgi:Glycosyl transferases group 1
VIGARLARGAVRRILLATERPASDAAWRVSAGELEDFEIHWPTTLGWAPIWRWVEPLFRGFRARTRVIRRDIPQRLAGTVLFEVRRRGHGHRVLINISDYPDLIHLGKSPEAEGAALEFKMQYLKGGYGVPNVIPGGFVSDSTLVDWLARRPRRIRARQQFCCDVYGRFGLNYATEIRTAAVRTLSAQSRFRFCGGGQKVDYRGFLREVATARVCLDLPGNGPFCFRLVNYLAVGACIVSPPYPVDMPEPLIADKHFVCTRADMSDLVDVCQRYVNDATAREAIAREGHAYYRRHLHWRSLADYYLRMMLDRLPA